MTVTSWTSPGTVTEDTSVGTDVFTNPANASSQTAGVFAVIDWASGSGQTSSRLKFTNFGFSIPTNATIDGFEIEYYASEDGSTDNLETKEWHIIQSDSTLITGTNLADTGEWINNATPQARGPVGGATNLCGYTGVTYTDVNDADFGCSFRCGTTGVATTPDGQVHKVRMRVYYTESTGYTLTASGGTYAATGTAASLEKASKASAAAGSYAVTGTTASLEYARFISSEAGAYSITGTATSLEYGAEIAGGAGAYTVTGTTASLEYSAEVNAEAGSYSVTGTDVAFQYGKLISAAEGSYTVTGTASSLEYHSEVAAGAGAYSITGTTASLESGAKIGAVSGSYSYTGTAASLESAAEVAAEAGSYSVSGTDATLLSAGISVISADGGVYTVNGIDVSLLRGAILSADTGQYVYTGYEADLTFTESDETPALRHYPHKWPLKVIYGKESYLVYSEQEQEALLKRLWKVEEVKRPKKRKKLRAYVEETNEPVSISYTFTAPDYSVLSDIQAEQSRLEARRAQDLDDEEALTLILMAI